VQERPAFEAQPIAGKACVTAGKSCEEVVTATGAKLRQYKLAPSLTSLQQ
jgi:hypothetical protein